MPRARRGRGRGRARGGRGRGRGGRRRRDMLEDADTSSSSSDESSGSGSGSESGSESDTSSRSGSASGSTSEEEEEVNEAFIDFDGSKPKSVNKDEFERLVGDVVRQMLFSDHKKVPVRRAQMTPIMKNYKTGRAKLWKATLWAARTDLRNVFGFDMVELPRDHDNKPSGAFILRNLMPEKARLTLSVPDVQHARVALLMFVLCAIFLNRRDIDGPLLWQNLERLGLSSGVTHPIFGKWEKVIDQFVSQKYLTKTRDNSKSVASQAFNDRATSFGFGPRTFFEISVRELLFFVAHVYGHDLDELHRSELEKKFAQELSYIDSLPRKYSDIEIPADDGEDEDDEDDDDGDDESSSDDES